MSEQDIAEEAVLDSEQPNLEETDQDVVSQTAGDSGESHEKKVTFIEEQQKVFNVKSFGSFGYFWRAHPNKI